MSTLRRIQGRLLLLLILVAAPVLFLMVVGSVHLVERGWAWWSYVPMTASWLAAYGLAWWISRDVRQDRQLRQPEQSWWTPRDQTAWNLIEAEIETLQPLGPDQITNLEVYASQTQRLALQLAQVYQPGTKDPFSHLTVPEILACSELIARELNQIVREVVPGSHLVTLGDLKHVSERVQDIQKVYPWLRNLYWAASVVLNPASSLRVATQIAVSQGAIAPTQSRIQANLSVWLQAAYLRQLGKYLIELNSGRLRIGVERYLALRESLRQASTRDLKAGPAVLTTAGSTAAAEAATVAASKSPGTVDPSSQDTRKIEPPLPIDLGATIQIAVVGPVKAGKSSLINAILGETRATVDVSPQTSGHVQYVYHPPGRSRLVLLDTQGFGAERPSAADVEVAATAVQQSDLVLFVIPARSAARAPEVEFLRHIRKTIQDDPTLKFPPLLIVLSQVDLLRPAMEWDPPYDFLQGVRLKEVTTREAIASVRQAFGPELSADDPIIPVCTMAGRVFNVDETLLPLMATRLDEARGVWFLRTLSTDVASARRGLVLRQLKRLGTTLAERLSQQLRE